MTAEATRLTATALLDLVLDDGSYLSWDRPFVRAELSEEYGAQLAGAEAKTGHDEAVITGEGSIHGHRVAVLASEFGFLAGSIGVDAAERLVLAIERATAEGLPLLAAPVSGGTRMQEGTVAFVQMVKITSAICRAQGGRAPVPRLPAQSHNRRRDGVVGVAGSRHGR
ncbi:MAG: carboxyl transferase domain-containing protein [Nocardioidaceae bacterium]